MPDGVDIEIDSTGYDGVFDSNIVLNNIDIDYDFDIGLKGNSSLVINNVIVHRGGIGFFPGTSNKETTSKIIVNNCDFNLKNTNAKIQCLGTGNTIKFTNCYFHGEGEELITIQETYSDNIEN